MSFFFNITISQHFCHPQFLNPPISSIPRLICSSRILDQCRIGALAQPQVNPDIKACVVEGRGGILEPIQVKTCYRTSALLRSAPLCYINNLFNHIKYSILISFRPLCFPHLVDPHKTYQQQVKGLSAPHHFYPQHQQPYFY